MSFHLLLRHDCKPGGFKNTELVFCSSVGQQSGTGLVDCKVKSVRKATFPSGGCRGESVSFPTFQGLPVVLGSWQLSFFLTISRCSRNPHAATSLALCDQERVSTFKDSIFITQDGLPILGPLTFITSAKFFLPRKATYSWALGIRKETSLETVMLPLKERLQNAQLVLSTLTSRNRYFYREL